MSRTVKDLVELGLVEIGEAPAGRRSSSAPSPAFEAEAMTSFAHVEPSVDDPPQPEPPILTVVGDATPTQDDVFDPNALGDRGADLRQRRRCPAAAPAELPSADDDMADAAEIARQLANLSPKAAKAVAAAAKATTTEEREAALAEVDDTEDPINRGLLLKFLGSVNG